MQKRSFGASQLYTKLVCSVTRVSVAFLVFAFSLPCATLAQTTVQFGQYQSIAIIGDAVGIEAIEIADLDGDGDNDIISVSSGDNKLAWYENLDGSGTMGPQRVIDLMHEAPILVTAADLDGDQDMDLLVADWGEGDYVWYENQHGDFAEVHEIPEGEFTRSQAVADLDGDDDLDILIGRDSFNGEVVWFENVNGEGDFSTMHVIEQVTDGSRIVLTGDIDGDMDEDIFIIDNAVSTVTPSDFGWYENLDGAGTFGAFNSFEGIRSDYNFLADFEGDGDLDFFAEGKSDDFVVYPNTDGDGTFGDPVSVAERSVSPVSMGDVDSDGDLDIVAYDPARGTLFYENLGDERGIVAEPVALEELADSEHDYHWYIADMNGDDRADLIWYQEETNAIAWQANLGGFGTFGNPTVFVTLSDAIDPYTVASGDFDGDGDQDVFSGSATDMKAAWYENLDGKGNFGEQHVLADDLFLIWASKTADLDNDNDIDIIVGAGIEIVWFENADGKGTFNRHTLTSDVRGTASLDVADVDSDEDLDVLSASFNDNKIAWYENTDGAGTFGEQQVITQETQWPFSVEAVDLDDDEDLDVISSSVIDGKIAWYENLDGSGNFGPQQVISSDYNWVRSLRAADIDGDGDQDIVGLQSVNEASLIWFENLDGMGQFGPAIEIVGGVIGGPVVYPIDLDQDQDIDIVAGKAGVNNLIWLENVDGAGTFGPLVDFSSFIGITQSIVAEDLNGDGVKDIITAASSDRVGWNEVILDAKIPVELADFQATVSNRTAFLSWITASEINNAGFEVQHGITNYFGLGEEWTPLMFIAGAGTTEQQRSYAYEVRNLSAGKHKFRLKQVDFDGRFTYSDVLIVEIGISGAFLITSPYPNPFNPTTQFSVTVARSQRVRISLYDVQGRHLHNISNSMLDAGTAHHFTIDAGRYASGLYLIKIFGEHFWTYQHITLAK